MSSNVVEVIIRAIDQMSGTLDKIGKTGGDLEHKLTANWKAIGLAAAAAGAGLELLARQQGELSRQTDQIAVTTGLSANEINQLARDVAGAGDSISDTLDLIKQAGKAGLESGDAIKQYAEYWDMVGDASGEVGAELADAATGLKHFGIDAENAADSADALGYVLNNTQTSLGEFLSLCQKVGPSLDKFDMDIDDMALMIDQLEEAGVSGKQAISAINEAAGDASTLPQFISNLEKATGAEIDFNKSLDGSAEKLKSQADAVDANVTPIERLTQAFSEFMYKNGELIQTMALMVPALAAVGPILAGLEAVSLASSISIAGMSVTLGGLLAVLGPIGIGIAAVTALWILNADSVEKNTASYKTGITAIRDMDKATKDAIPSLRDYIDLQNEAAKSGANAGTAYKLATGDLYQFTGEYTKQGVVVGDTASQIAQAERDIAHSRKETSKVVAETTGMDAESYKKVTEEYKSLGYSAKQTESLIAQANAVMGESTMASAEKQIEALNRVAQAWMDAAGVANAVSGDAMAAYKNAAALKGQEVLSGKNPQVTTLNFTGKQGLPAGYNEVKYLDQNAYASSWTDGEGKVHNTNYDLMTQNQQWAMEINSRGWALDKKNSDGEWRRYSGVSGGSNPFGNKLFMEALAIFASDQRRIAQQQKEASEAAEQSAGATEQSTQANQDSNKVTEQSTKVTEENTSATNASNESINVQKQSIFDMMKKYQESDAAMGKSRGTLDHWNTSVVGNTEKMSKETLGSVEGMSSGVRAGAGRTTRDISETWNQIGKDSEEGTAGLGNDWKSFLQSARRDLQAEVQACSGPGCGFTGGGAGDGTGTGLEPVYDLEELWRRRGLPRAARGAKIVGAGDILVGEERPEVVRLPQGASVHPLSEYDGGFGGRAGNVYQITINTQGVIGDKSTARQFARWIMEALDFETIRKGTVA